MEGLRKRQEEEVEVLKSIFNDDLKDLRKDDVWKVWRPPELKLRLFPTQGLSGDVGCGNFWVDLHVSCAQEYPDTPPNLGASLGDGLDGCAWNVLQQELDAVKEKCKGEVMILELAQCVQQFLHVQMTGRSPIKSLDSPGAKVLSFYERMQKEQSERAKLSKEQQVEQVHKQVIEIEEELKRRKDERFDQATDDLEGSEAFVNSLPERYRSSSLPPESAGENGPTPAPGAQDQSHLMPQVEPPSKAKRVNLRNRSSSSDVRTVTDFMVRINGKDEKVYKGAETEFGPKFHPAVSDFYGLLAGTGQPALVTQWSFLLHSSQLRCKPSLDDLKPFFKQVYLVAVAQAMCTSLKVERTSQSVLVHLVKSNIAGSTLMTAYMDPGIGMEQAQIRFVAKDILEALAFLHSKSVIHRNVILHNIWECRMYGAGGGGSTGMTYKLADFSTQKKLLESWETLQKILKKSPQDDTEAVCLLAQPNFLGMGRQGAKADVFLFGACLLALLKAASLESDVFLDEQIPAEGIVGVNLRSFLGSCLRRAESERLTPAQLLSHPFLTSEKGDNKTFLKIEGNDKDVGTNESEYMNLETDSAAPLMAKFGQILAPRLNSEFDVLQWLGRGGFGDVIKVRNKLDGNIYALKRILLNPKSRHLNRKITREVKLLSRLNHENVVRYYNSWIESVTMASEEAANSSSSKEDQAANGKEKCEIGEVLNLKKGGGKNDPFASDEFDELDAPPMPSRTNDSDWTSSLYALSNKGQNDESSSSELDEEEENIDVFGGSYYPRKSGLTSEDGVLFEGGESKGAESSSVGDDKEENRGPESERECRTEESEDKNGEMTVQLLHIQMELCEKSTLRQAIDSGLLHKEVKRAWRLFREVLEGLVHIHQQGMIHRDLKPVNIFLDSNDHAKIGDFGLATQDMVISAREAMSETKGSLIGGTSQKDGMGLTGQVGTALYVSPELVTARGKLEYTQKVDMYSMGVILFEMLAPPLGTGMERFRVLTDLRKPEIIVPEEIRHNSALKKQQILSLLQWLLSHQAESRPTAAELLASPLLPSIEMEDREFESTLVATLIAPRTRKYKHLMARIFDRNPTAVEDFVYDSELYKGSFTTHGAQLMSYVEEKLVSVFKRHGAANIPPLSLMPKSAKCASVSQCIMCDSSGFLTSLPFDLRMGFARLVARREIESVKRYHIGKVYRPHKLLTSHPYELTECAFDVVVDCQAKGSAATAEVCYVASEIIGELPAFQPCTFVLKLNHGLILQALLIHVGIDESGRQVHVLELVRQCLGGELSRAEIAARLEAVQVSQQTLENILKLLKMEAPYPKVANHLRNIILKRKGAAADIAKQGLKELETTVSLLESTLRFPFPIVIALDLIYNLHEFWPGTMFNLMGNINVRKRGRTALAPLTCIFAAGGRYDDLVFSFMKPSLNAQPLTPTAVGISFDVDKIAAFIASKEEKQKNSQMDAIVVSLGGTECLLKEKMGLCKILWGVGLSADYVLEPVSDLGPLTERCVSDSVRFLLILKDTEPGFVKLKSLGSGSGQQQKLGNFPEQFISIPELESVIRHELDEPGTSVPAQYPQVDPVVPVHHSSSGMNLSASKLSRLNITFVTPQKKLEKNDKRRYEMQIFNSLEGKLGCFGPKEPLELLAFDLPSQVVNYLVTNLNFADLEGFRETCVETLSKFGGKFKPTLPALLDHISDLKFEKCMSVIILYSFSCDCAKFLLPL